MAENRLINILVLFLLLTMVKSNYLLAQSGTSSALTGTITDKSGAVIPSAQVKAIEVNTGAVRIVQSNADGRFLFSQVNPGTYRIEVHSDEFGPAQSQPTSVSVGQTVTVNFTLFPAATEQTVEVREQFGLMSLENPNTSTTLEAETIKNLPNPGQDLTYVAQFAPGALMNTAGSSNDAKAAGGYGNVEFNGLPATSNGYILDGFDANDPFLGLNVGLSTNLVIGLDALQEATVNTNSYAVDQGRYGASQVNYFTKSGTNRFHGDAYEIWNGSLLNATDYFLHANDTPGNIAKKPRSTVNEFGVSVGGPLLRDRLFFFTHYEGIRIALPLVARTTVPSQAYQQYLLQQLPLGGTDPINGTMLPAQPEEVAFYKKMFSLYRNTAGTPTPVLTCPLDASGALLPGTQTATNLFNGSGCANIRTQSMNNSDSENLIVVKIDHTINAEQQHLVSLPAGHRLAGRLHRPDQPDLQRVLSAAAADAGARLHTHLHAESRQSIQPRRELVFKPLSAQQLFSGASEFPHRAVRRQFQCTLHHGRRQRPDLYAGSQGDPVADQRQPHLDDEAAIVSSSARTLAGWT